MRLTKSLQANSFMQCTGFQQHFCLRIASELISEHLISWRHVARPPWRVHTVCQQPDQLNIASFGPGHWFPFPGEASNKLPANPAHLGKIRKEKNNTVKNDVHLLYATVTPTIMWYVT